MSRLGHMKLIPSISWALFFHFQAFDNWILFLWWILRSSSRLHQGRQRGRGVAQKERTHSCGGEKCISWFTTRVRKKSDELK